MDRAVVAEVEVMAVVIVPDRAVVASIGSNFKAGKANIKYVDDEPSYEYIKEYLDEKLFENSGRDNDIHFSIYGRASNDLCRYQK
jgi:hypothetical protein